MENSIHLYSVVGIRSRGHGRRASFLVGIGYGLGFPIWAGSKLGSGSVGRLLEFSYPIIEVCHLQPFLLKNYLSEMEEKKWKLDEF